MAFNVSIELTIKDSASFPVSNVPTRIRAITVRSFAVANKDGSILESIFIAAQPASSTV